MGHKAARLGAPALSRVSARSHCPRSDPPASGPAKARPPMSPSLGTKNSFLLDAQKGEESKPQEERGYLAVFSCFHLFIKKKKKKKMQIDPKEESSTRQCRHEWGQLSDGVQETEPRAERKREVRRSAGIWP